MDVRTLLQKNRSYRRFYQDVRIPEDSLIKWVDNTRFCASGRNMQSLKYLIVNDESLCNQLFPALGWAGYLKEWGGPHPGEQPAAYILVYHDSSISENHYFDEGIAVQSILLSATEEGYGGCILVSVNKSLIKEQIDMPEAYQLLCVLALGKPKEEVQLVDMVDNAYRYFRDEQQIHYVPKRKLSEILLTLKR